MSYKCDICGNDADANEYIFPVWVNAYGGPCQKIMASKIALDKCVVNLCTDCKMKIADMTYHH